MPVTLLSVSNSQPEDIPTLDLGDRAHQSTSPLRAQSPEGAGNEQESRRASFSSTGRPSVSGRSGSGSSSRSTSFSLPPEAVGRDFRDSGSERGEVEVEEIDEEGDMPSYLLTACFLMLFILAAAKHAAFIRARGRHYSNEAEAMKVIVC